MLRIGLVGTGYINEVHASAAEEVENVKITSVCSRDEKKADDFAEKYNIFNAFFGYEAMLDSGEIDAVIIGIPTPFHKEYVLKAFEYSIHVLCEKPIALTVEDANEMLKKSEEKNVIFMIAQVLRFWPEYVKVKELIENNLVGKVKKISTFRFSTIPAWSDNNWLLDKTQSGGVPVDLQIHDIDFIRWILGEPKKNFAAGNINEKGLIINSSSIFKYDSATAVSEAGYIFPENMKFKMGFNIITDSSVIEYDNLREPSLTIKKGDKPFESIEVEENNAYANQLRYFVECIKNKKQPERITTRDAIESLSLSLKIKSLIESKK